jgi:hypothetical protein
MSSVSFPTREPERSPSFDERKTHGTSTLDDEAAQVKLLEI